MDTKELIRAEALKLFSRRGYDAVGIQEIVDNSKITKPTLYHHFGSKLGLFEDLLGFYYTPLINELNENSAYNGDLTKTLNTVTASFFKAAGENPDFFRLKLSLDFTPLDSEIYPLIKKYNEKIFSYIEKIFINAVKDHGNMKGRHAIYAASFIGLNHTYIALHLNGYISGGDQIKQQIVKYFMHGIFS